MREGDVLAISEPRNNFPLRRDATRTVLIAGGIGITPLLSMARFLDKSSLPYELHYFTRAGEQVAFRGDLEALHGKVHLHTGLPRDRDRHDHRHALGPHGATPSTSMSAAPAPCSKPSAPPPPPRAGPTKPIHFEYFKNDKVIDDSSAFDVELARSAMTLHVPAGKTILEVMRDAGLTVPSSCEQGACGTCLTTVIGGRGRPSGRLSQRQRKALQHLHDDLRLAAPKSARLVLDI